MTFLEFLDALGESRYGKLLEDLERPDYLPEAFHSHLIDLLRHYYFVGGMPECVKYFSETRDALEVRRIQDEIIKSYVLDFAKHAPPADIPKLTLVWESIPRHLARENKKFIFSTVRKGARAREYEHALTWLEDSGLIYWAHMVETPKSPLMHYANSSSFKVYALDVGLLGALAKVPANILAQGQRLFNEYEGAFVENYVAEQLVAHFQMKLSYWRSKGGKAELDFLCEWEDQVLPLEVKAGINPRSKSLRSYDMRFQPKRLIRTNLIRLVPRQPIRFLYEKINWSNRLFGIIGGRGTGKTTLLLQYLAMNKKEDPQECLYLSADNVKVEGLGLYEIISDYFRLGGQEVVIDEIHKGQGWPQVLKNLYDSFPGSRIRFSGSSTLALQLGKTDLSRRAVFYNLPGLSFREYLAFIGHGHSRLYIHNTNLLKVIGGHIRIDDPLGTVRETFFQHQVRSAGYRVSIPKKADFFVEDRHVFEIGGNQKKKSR